MNGFTGFRPCFERTLITGGGSGIGRDVAIALANAGVDVTVVGRRQEALDETVRLAKGADGRMLGLSCDFRDPDQVESVWGRAEADGPIQSFVNAAAGAFLSLGEQITPNG